jgi:hypothetical protein
MVMNGLAVKILLAIALCVLAVSLAVLLVPGHSWAAAFEWLTNPPQIVPCGCMVDPGSNG